MSTSGKSTVIDLLAKAYNAQNIRILSEEQTHIPIMDQTDKDHQDFFIELIKKAILSKPDIVMIDRLYMTQAFRAKISLNAYSKLETLLTRHNTLSIFLKVDEQSIASRVSKATEHREPNWREYLRAKGDTPDKIAEYYIQQQRSQLQLLKTSKLPYQIFDTTNHNYENILFQIKEILNQ